jgi:hypothetical protein
MGQKKKVKMKPVHKCQQKISVSYTPAPNADPKVEIEISESTSDTKTCQSTATYVLNGVHYCDHHYTQVTSTNSEEYGEYSDPNALETFPQGD